MSSFIVSISLTISCNHAFASIIMYSMFFFCNADVAFVQKVWDSLVCFCCSCSFSGSNLFLTYPCPFCLGTVSNLSGKQLLATADVVAYKDGHEVYDDDGDISMEEAWKREVPMLYSLMIKAERIWTKVMLWFQTRRILSALKFLTQPQGNGQNLICLNDSKLLSNNRMTCYSVL